MKKGKPGVSSSNQPKVTSNSDHGLNNPVQKPVFKTLNSGNNADTIQTFDDDDEWELGVGNLIIDLDADLERNDPSPALQPQVKAEMEHQATVDKGLKMKIKRKTLKTPEAGAAGASKVGKDAKMINDSKNKRAVVKKEKSKKDQAQNGLNHTKSDDPYEFNAKVEDRIRVPVKKTTKAEKAATPPSSPTPKSSQAADLSVPVETTERKHACTETMDMSTCTEPEFLGPCEPGTSVMLGGIVWQETENGVLVVNVTWRGKTYVGTLLDATRHDWAPPRFNCESPTSETPKGRGVKRNCRAGVGTPENIIETRKLRKGRRGVVRNFQAPPSPAKSDITPISSAKRKQRSAEMDVNDDVKKRARSISRGTPTEPEPKPNSQGYIECPEANCSKKYRHMNGLKYHQSHAHSGNMEGEDSSGSRPATPVTPSVTDRIKEFEFEETQDNAEEEQTDANENKADHNHIENKEKEEEPVKEDEEVVDEEKPNENPEEIENVHSPAYSDISDAAESAPVEKTAEPDAKPAKEVHVPTPVSGFNAFTYYGQKPYLIPAMGEKQPLKSPNTTESSHRAEAFHDEFGDNKPTTSQPLFSPGQQPIITSFGFMGKPYIGPAEQFRDDEAQKAQQARLSDEQKQKDTPPATERPQRPADAEKPGSSTATSSPADNVQKPEIRIKSEPRDPLLERHQEDLKRFYMYQKQKQHDQRAEEAERYDERMRSVMKIKQEPTSADRPEPDKPEKEVFKPDLKRPSSPQEKSVIQEKRSKPTMPSPATTPKSKPPTPTLLPPYGQFAVAPNLIQGPYGPVQIDPHSPYRVPGGINGPLLGFPGSPAYMHPALRYHVPPMEKEKQMMMSPGARHLDQPKALDLLQQHASHYYNSSQHHKIHELERAGRPDSGTPPKSRAGPSPVSVVAPKDIAGLHASPRHMSPPPQRHVHTHHHTHLMGGYPLYDPYGAMINAGQGPSPLPPGAIGHPAFPPK